MNDNEQIPKFKELVSDIPKKYIFLMIFVVALVAAGILGSLIIL